MMKCKAIRKEIEDVTGDSLLSESVRAHLSSCAACRVFSDERAALKGLMASLGAVEAPNDFDWRLRSRLARARSETPRAFSLTPSAPGLQAIAIAASFVLLVVAAVVYKQTKPEPANVSQPATVAQSTNPSAVVEPDKSSDSIVALQDKKDVSDAVAAKPGETFSNRGRSSRNARPNPARTDSQAAPASQRIFSNDFGSLGAQNVVPSALNNSLRGAGPVISLPVRSSGQPARLQFEDSLGAKRTLSLNPVNFGGQEAIERRDAARLVPTSAQGIW